MKAQTYEVVPIFRDPNQPRTIVLARTLREAQLEAQHMTQMLASLKAVYILEPDGTKAVFNAQGYYQFSLPPLESRKETPA